MIRSIKQEKKVIEEATEDGSLLLQVKDGELTVWVNNELIFRNRSKVANTLYINTVKEIKDKFHIDENLKSN